MDWMRILAKAGIAESPGRQEAIAAAQASTKKRKAAKAEPAAPKSKTKRKR
jgi:hypothetical protein